MTLAEIEKYYILEVMRDNGDNKKLVAEKLGINLKTLYNKLRSYGVDVSKRGRPRKIKGN